jgi:hypothetical protein
VRVLRCPVIAGVSLILAFSQKEKGQSRKVFAELPIKLFYSIRKKEGNTIIAIVCTF